MNLLPQIYQAFVNINVNESLLIKRHKKLNDIIDQTLRFSIFNGNHLLPSDVLSSVSGELNIASVPINQMKRVINTYIVPFAYSEGKQAVPEKISCQMKLPKV